MIIHQDTPPADPIYADEAPLQTILVSFGARNLMDGNLNHEAPTNDKLLMPDKDSPHIG